MRRLFSPLRPRHHASDPITTTTTIGSGRSSAATTTTTTTTNHHINARDAMETSLHGTASTGGGGTLATCSPSSASGVPNATEVSSLLHATKKLVKEAADTAVGDVERKAKIQAARDLLDRALTTHHNHLPNDISRHVVIGLCSMDNRTMGWLLQYMSALRKLIHLPIVILGTNVDRFHDTSRRLQTRFAQSYRHPVLGDACVRVPSATDIYLVEGSPQSKADLERCRVQKAYAVILLGDGVADKEDAHDPVLSDRPVLLSSFSLETVLRCGPERRVITIADLRLESNASLLRQRYRSSQGPSEPGLVNLQAEEAGFNGQHHYLLNSHSVNTLNKFRDAHDTLTRDVQSSLKVLYRGSRINSRMSFSANPVLAAGKAICRNFFDCLFVSFYQSPTSLRFWREIFRTVHDDMDSGDFMWGGSIGYQPQDTEGGYNILTGNGDLQTTVDSMRSTLDMISVPVSYVGRTYHELVEALIANDIVTLGMYRRHSTDDAPLPYAVVNPPGKTELTRKDLLYILRPWCTMPRGGGLGGSPSTSILSNGGGGSSIDGAATIRRSASSVR